ncbi:FtsB family cell division protein [Radiobacillus sp. PE A8.2]|uniref:FtsB family cell division protein n=1 Tax=Radiobacillus sp. PE A8.2 TaxID=3380349 RepID=UPI003890418B
MTRKEAKVAKIESTYVKQYDAQVERQKKKKKRLFRRLVLFSVIVMISIGSLTTFHLKQRAIYAQKQEQLEQLENQMSSLEEQEENLQQEVELLNDEEYVNKIARTNYFFSEEGEIIFKLPDEKPSY